MDMMSLIDTFFKTDDLKALIHQAGQMLNCPMIAIDDAFQIQASYSPENFQDDVFFAALHRGEITYEAILAISQNEQISQGKSVRMRLQDTPYPRCFAALISSEIRIGYLIYVDWKDTLSQVPESDLQMLQTILAKQLLSESSRNRILSSTSEEILVRLLQGEFPSESVFQLQTASSYLAQYHPHRLVVVDLGLYRNLHFGQDTLKTELRYLFYASHPFFLSKAAFVFPDWRSRHNIAPQFQPEISAAHCDFRSTRLFVPSSSSVPNRTESAGIYADSVQSAVCCVGAASLSPNPSFPDSGSGFSLSSSRFSFG